LSAGNLNVNNAFVANNSGAYHSGLMNAASFNVGTSTFANANGVYTGIVNATSMNSALFSVGSTFTANASLINAAAINITGQVNTATFYSATSANVGANVQTNTSSFFVGSNGSVNTIIAAGAVTINGGTLAAGNTTITGFANVSTGVNTASFTVGTLFSANSTLVNAQAINIVNQVNTTTLYAVTSVNVASAVLANATGLWSTGTVNGAVISQGTNFVANSSGAYSTGTVNAATISTTNFTANSSTATHGTQLSSPLHTTGDGLYVANNSTIFVGNNSVSRSLANTTAIVVGNSSVNAYINSTSFSGVALTANNAAYLGGYAAETYVTSTANVTITGFYTISSNLTFTNTAIINANGRFGTVNQLLASNGTAMYWADSSVVGANALYAYNWTNSHIWGNTTQQANITISNGYFINGNTTISSSALTNGNTSVNAYVTQTGFVSTNGTITTNASTLGVYVGANSYINATTHFISSNATTNTVISANQITLNGANVMTTATTLKVYYANGTQAFP
jgi:hypothetical protein